MSKESNSHLRELCTFLFFLCASIAISTTVEDGSILTVNEVSYYSGGDPVSRILTSVDFDPSRFKNLLPLTVIRTDQVMLNTKNLQDIISNYSTVDDVFQVGFLETVLLVYKGHGQARAESSVKQRLQEFGNTLILASPAYRPKSHLTPAHLEADIPRGPYFYSPQTGELYQAFRLYSDHQLAFTEACLSDGADGFKPLSGAASGAMTKTVAVPSRLYYTPTSQKPLAGLRMGVKDIFDLKGLRTGGGSRAYYDLYPPRNTTSSAVQILIDAGIVVIGKMGTVQFANGDNPTADWVDFHCPFNPRGDGYQAPGGSSSGSSVGIASYDWLDIAIGSDTGGSMRNPGGMQGLFANRPSTGAVNLDHMVPMCHELDTAGVFARDAATWSRVMHAWYRNFIDYRQYPKRIFYQSSSFPSVNTAAGALLEKLVMKLEMFLGVDREFVNISSRWMETHSSGTPALGKLLNTTYAFLVSVDQYRSLALPFYADYAAKHNGRRPFVNPGPFARWAWGQENGGNDAFNEALRNMTIFKDWWETEGFGKANQQTCSEGIYIYPYSKGETQYRNVYFSAPVAPPMGFSDSSIAVYAGVPDLVVPVGEIPYNSTVSLKTEAMPVTMSFVAAKGCDLMLVNLIADMEKAGAITPVSTGPRMYPD